MNHPQQPREYDAVLGDQNPLLEGAAVLGGIEGVKLRLINPDPKVRIAALGQALNYGEQGLYGSSALSMLNQSAKKLKVLLYKKNRHYF